MSDQWTEDEIKASMREIADARRDAARYKWVRENGPYNWAPWATAEAMDAAIDAQLAGPASGKPDA